MWRYGKLDSYGVFSGKLEDTIEEDHELEPEVCAKMNALPIRTVEEPRNPRFYIRNAVPEYAVIESVEILEKISYVERDTVEQDKIAYLAQYRWEVETGGALWGTWFCYTEQADRQNYQAELLAVSMGRRVASYWKFPHGFEFVTNEQMVDMVYFVRDYVQACFNAEAYAEYMLPHTPPDEALIRELFDEIFARERPANILPEPQEATP